jgi:hypothetical protein
MTKKRTQKRRRTQIKELRATEQALPAKELKKVKGGAQLLQDAAKQLDATSQSGGPTAAQNQKIQELTFNLQQIDQK